MKPKIKFITLISFILILLSFKNLTNPVNITGHLKPKLSEQKDDIMALKIFVKGDDKILAETLTDKNGNFNLTFTPEKEKSFDFYCSGIGIGTLLLNSVSNFESDNVEMILDYPAKYKKSKFGKVICIKCKRTDKVYKIENSISPVVTLKIDKFGDTIYSKIYKGKYQEDCTSGPAKYYCDRDKVKF